MQGKSVSPLTFSGNPQFSRWYQQFHSAIRGVSMALMKSQSPSATVTRISIAPTPFISGIARFGSVPAARSWPASSSDAVRTPSLSASIAGKSGGRRPPAASAAASAPSVSASERPAAAGRPPGVDLQARGRMGVAGDGALRLGPAQHRRGPRGPAFGCGPVRARVGLIAQVQQADMPSAWDPNPLTSTSYLRTVNGSLTRVGVRLEEPALIVVARSPGQDAADVQALALDLEEHVLGPDALGRGGVVGAARGVDVVIAAVEAVGARVDPALQPDLDRRLAPRRDFDLPADQAIFGPSAIGHGHLARGECIPRSRSGWPPTCSSRDRSIAATAAWCCCPRAN